MGLPAVYIAASKRTAFGAFGGKLKAHTATQLGAVASKAAIAGLPPGVKFDSVHFGGVLQSDPQSPYMARHIGILSGLPVEVPAATTNRLCGSGFQAVVNAAHEIKLGEANVVLTGGSDCLSITPYALSGTSRWGQKYGSDPKLVDNLLAVLSDTVPKPIPMGITAENLANMYNITREDCDVYALQSQTRWKQGLDAGAFSAEIAPMELPGRKRGSAPEVFEQDEHARPQSTLESLAKLQAVFSKGGQVTAGNASGICDGAAANVVVSEAALEKYGIQPLAKVLSYHVVGVEPSLMGIGPVEAIRGALAKAGLTIAEIDLFDINEAFAAQFLACQKELGLPNEKTNVFGGAIALGHPLAASGARIVGNLAHNLQRLGLKYGVGAACIGGGQGIAVVLESTPAR